MLGREPLRWREHSGFGPITFRTELVEPPRRFRARIDDEDQPFGGSWTWEVVPAGDGGTVTITERGEVYNPVFRFLSRYVFGHHGTQEAYLRDLGRRYGETPELVRIETES